MAKTSTSSQYLGIGRRKSAVARVWLRPGRGSILVNGKDSNDYFDSQIARLRVRDPLAVVGKKADGFDAVVNVCGGGMMSQADATRLGLSRALVDSDVELKPLLKKHKFLVCDSRVKERKKYGQRGARRKFQFVKR